MRARTAALLACWLSLASAAAVAGESAGPGYPLRSPSAAPAVQAVAAPAVTATLAEGFENQPLTFRDSSRRSNRTGGGYGAQSIFTLLFYIVVLGAVFCGFLYLVKRYIPGHRQLFSHPAMEILGRTHLDQRRYVSLVRVGKRIVVVGVSPDEMRSLSEITDEEEITAIMEVARPKTEAGLTIFQRLFKRNVIEAEAAESRAEAREQALAIEEQTSFLREQVRAIRESEAPATRVDAIG